MGEVTMPNTNYNLPNLKYKFHDSLLENVEIGPRREVTLHIILDSTYYEGGPKVQVRFGAITNFDSVNESFKKVVEEKGGVDKYVRVEALGYDESEKSTAGKLFLRLKLDRMNEIKIHCGNFSMENEANSLENPV